MTGSCQVPGGATVLGSGAGEGDRGVPGRDSASMSAAREPKSWAAVISKRGEEERGGDDCLTLVLVSGVTGAGVGGTCGGGVGECSLLMSGWAGLEILALGVALARVCEAPEQPFRCEARP